MKQLKLAPVFLVALMSIGQTINNGGGSGGSVGAGTIAGTPNQITATGAGCSGAGTCTLSITTNPTIPGHITTEGVTATGATGTGNFVFATSPTLTTPSIGAATGTSLLASGIVDGTAPVTVTTGSSATLGGTYKSGYTINEEATAGQAITYTLPTAAAGLQYCVGNGYNGSAANTGTLEILTSASGQFIIFTDGTLSATGGYVISGGAAADFACVVGVDSTHWYFRPSSGTWTKH